MNKRVTFVVQTMVLGDRIYTVNQTATFPLAIALRYIQQGFARVPNGETITTVI